MNLVEASIEGGRVRFGDVDLPLPADRPAELEGAKVILGIRPSDMEDAAVWRNETLPTIHVRADVTENLGSEINVLFAVDAPPVASDIIAATIDEPDATSIAFLDEGTTQFVARVDARSSVRTGEMVRLSVDPSRFYFFDRSSGDAIGSARPVAVSAS
jgi:multiple sugar transport system ATP-binding protein